MAANVRARQRAEQTQFTPARTLAANALATSSAANLHARTDCEVI